MLGILKQLVLLVSVLSQRAEKEVLGLFGHPRSTTIDPTVILGGGIIGLSTAYYLSDTLDNGIVVIDTASGICAGASGQCEGAIGDFGVFEKLIPINSLSFQLHQQLAAENLGQENYGFARLDIHTVFPTKYDPKNPKLPFPVQGPEDLSDLPPWLKVSNKWHAALIANQSHAARLDPPRFCRFLQEECQRRGVKFLFDTTVSSVLKNKDQEGPYLLSVKQTGTRDILQIPFKNLVISAGSWSGQLFSKLFPESLIRIPFTENQPAQNWMRIKTPHWELEDDKKGCHQVFLDPVVKNMSFHISTFLGGEMYLANDIVPTPGKLPNSADDVKAQPSSIDAMKTEALKRLVLDNGESLEVLSEGRAYLPQLESGLPIITKIPWQDLYQQNFIPQSEQHSRSQHQQVFGTSKGSRNRTVGGVFLNVGHYLDGFAVGPGSGKLMAELILGKEPSVDTSPFDLPSSARKQ